MKCPYCGHLDDRVIDSRMSQDGVVTRRRRECAGCEKRFTTYERIEESLPMVVKKDGRREPFDHGKLLAGVRKACEKRPVALERIDALVDAIERELIESGDREVSTTRIGEAVMVRLRDLDDVAYVRFASVYRSFRDLQEFMDELSTLVRGRTERTRG